MHRTRVALTKASRPSRPTGVRSSTAPFTRLHAEDERQAALSAMRAEDAYVQRYRSLPSSNSLQVGAPSGRRTSIVSSSSRAAQSGSMRSGALSTSTDGATLDTSKASMHASTLGQARFAATSARATSKRPGDERTAQAAPKEGAEDESSWAFGGGASSQGGPAEAKRNANSAGRAPQKIEFIVEGDAGKGAVPNYGRRRKHSYETDKTHDGPAARSKDDEIAKGYRHDYAPTARSPRPLPHHTYFSSPSSSFNDDAAATAAGVGPVGVGGPRSGLGMGAGTHELVNKVAIMRKKSALILPGQGSQYVGMTDDIFRKYRAARQVWTMAEEALSFGSKAARHLSDLVQQQDEASLKEIRQRFEDELERSAEWDPYRGPRAGSGTAVSRNRRGWLRDVVFAGDQLNLTRAENAQPSILVASLSILSVLRQEFGVDLIANHIDYVAGHGTGVYAALCASGSLDMRDAARALRHRGLASSHFVAQNKTLFPDGCRMPESIYETWAFANAGSGKGAELLGGRSTFSIDAGGVPPTSSATDASVALAESAATPQRGWKRSQMSGCMIRPGKLQESLRAVEQVAAEIREGKLEHIATDEVVEVANINSSLQIVLSGTRVGVSTASDRLRQLNLGARAVNLPVSGPYHSSLMADGAHFLYPIVDALPLREPDPTGHGRGFTGPLQLVSSMDGAPILHNVDEIRNDLRGALARPVMWLQSINRMLEHGVQRFICLGPGRACAHLLSKELAHRDRMNALEGKPAGNYEVWSINSVEDVEQIGAVLSRLSAEDGATRNTPDMERFVAV